MRLAFDLDGCFVEFNAAYADLLIKTTGKDLFPKGWRDDHDLLCPVWEYASHFGYTQEQEDKAWELINRDPEFWKNLRPMFGARAALRHINQLAKRGHDIYFITSRPGVMVKRQTEQWLYDMGIDFPTVIISFDKVPVLKGLKADMFLDDKLPTILAAAGVGTPVDSTFLFSRPYNRADRPENAEYVVTSVAEALERMKLAP